nr:unnamed protein product [Rangifer tarandus platyrhynchus]
MAVVGGPPMTDRKWPGCSVPGFRQEALPHAPRKESLQSRVGRAGPTILMVIRDGSRSGPASPQGRGKEGRHLLGSQSGDFVLGLTPTGHRGASKRECGKRWGIDAIRAENARGAPTCARLPTAGPKPPAHDPLPAPRHPSPRTNMPLRTYTHYAHIQHMSANRRKHTQSSHQE